MGYESRKKELRAFCPATANTRPFARMNPERRNCEKSVNLINEEDCGSESRKKELRG